MKRITDIRKVWPKEADDFTPWLKDNIEIVGEIVGLEFYNVEREQAAGTFSVDLVAEYNNGDFAIIENQLEESNHKHLGQVITYLVSWKAKTAIWIVSDFRSEHRDAIKWLNESFSADFYLLKIEAIEGGDNEALPLLTLIVGPSEEGRKVGRRKKEISEKSKTHERFWDTLLEQAKDITTLHALSFLPRKTSEIWTRVGSTDRLLYKYVIRRNDTLVGLSAC